MNLIRMSNFRPISIPRNPERKNIDPEETPRYICSETLLLHFSVADAVPPQRTTERLASSNRDSERVLIGLSEAGLRDRVPRLDVENVFSVIVEPSLLAS